MRPAGEIAFEIIEDDQVAALIAAAIEQARTEAFEAAAEKSDKLDAFGYTGKQIAFEIRHVLAGGGDDTCPAEGCREPYGTHLHGEAPDG